MYPTVTITGPRQSGKTTLARTMLPDWDYVSLEDPEIREFCLYDCKGFLLMKYRECPTCFLICKLI